jgi:hypothetical protein
MKKLIIATAAFLSLSAFYVSDNYKKIFKNLYALDGKWAMTTKRGIICEEWKKMNKNYLQSKGYIVKGIDTIVNERVVLTKTTEGIFYTSIVEDQNNKQPVAFKMMKAENNMFVFENPQHDFPKRIVYKFITADSLQAYVDYGTDDGTKRQSFFYTRQK